MAKARTVYVCQNCGRQSPKEMGRCPSCSEYNTFVQEIIVPAGKSKAAPRGLSGRSTPMKLSEITDDVDERLHVSIGEFARVLGGGIVPGSIVLIGGDPGIGKSTLLLQTAMEMAKDAPVLYVSGEESERQIKMRATRLLKQANVDGAINLPAPEVRTRHNELDPSLPVVVICGTGHRSSMAGSILKQHGFERVMNAAGGMTGYAAAGLGPDCPMCVGSHGPRFLGGNLA